jgi:toxin ParE1/3/4
MKRRVQKLLEAKRDLVEAADYYAEQSGLALANRFLKAAEKSFEFLAGTPFIGGVWETSHPQLQNLRHWAVRGFENYVIFYRPIPDGVEIVRVLHGARDLQNILDKGGEE